MMFIKIIMVHSVLTLKEILCHRIMCWIYWKIIKERNEDERKVNKWKALDKMDKRDECNTSEEQLCDNEEEHEKKRGSDEVKEKNNIHNGECNR